ncbi:MAG: hypothetical protein AAFO69_20320 [Bacteroidota bacterium]
MKMIQKNVQFILVLSLVNLFTFLSGCGSDEPEEVELPDQEASFAFTVNGFSGEVDFSTNVAVSSALRGSTTGFTGTVLVIGGGVLNEELVVSLGFRFADNSTGTYVFTEGLGDDEDTNEGLTFGVADFRGIANEDPGISATYDASNVSVIITSYQDLGSGVAAVEGSFSGIGRNRETGEEVMISGSFNTGNLF